MYQGGFLARVGLAAAAEIGNLYGLGIMPGTVGLLIDAEEDPMLRAVLVGMLRETG